MTDAPDQPYPEAADRLRRTLATVAAATPTPDRSADLLARLDAEHGAPPPPALSDLGPSSRRRPPRWRLLAAAAGVLVLLAAAAVVATRDGGDVATSPGDPGTGWFLPPAGWTVTTVDVDFLDVGEGGACPCTHWVAARPGTGSVILLTETGPGVVDESSLPGEPIDVGGRAGRYADPGLVSTLVAQGAGRQVSVVAQDVGRDELVTLVDAALDQAEAGSGLDTARLPLPEGFVATEPVTKPARTAEHLVAVQAVEDATGRTLNYEFAPPGYLRDQVVGATDLRVEGGRVTGAIPTTDGGGAEIALGGPEDVVAGGTPFGWPTDSFTEGELQRFADGLREVPTADWRAALDRAEGTVDGRVEEAETLTSPPMVEP